VEVVMVLDLVVQEDSGTVNTGGGGGGGNNVPSGTGGGAGGKGVVILSIPTCKFFKYYNRFTNRIR
jgi:hypothetical protein